MNDSANSNLTAFSEDPVVLPPIDDDTVTPKEDGNKTKYIKSFPNFAEAIKFVKNDRYEDNSWWYKGPKPSKNGMFL